MVTGRNTKDSLRKKPLNIFIPRSVLERYNITSEEDLKEAARKRQIYNEKQAGQLQFSYSQPVLREKVITLGL